ncbi:MAG: alpha/beta fold hydrolase [Candidatus Hydrogenedentes bacterium]|nr:alpha/beta fold hydrolase [Candidatus Hydrogenedentota bacterium]
MYVPAAEAPPGILLLHRYGGNRKLWEQVASILQQQGIMVLALDLRGHGDSSTKLGNSIHYRQLPDDSWMQVLQDIRAAKKVLLEKGVDSHSIVIAGEGLGAALALHYALEDSDIQGVVMVSPGLDLLGIPTEEAIKQLDDCPTLLCASEGDSYAATSASALNQSAPVYSELRIWSGTAHGVDLFAAHPESIVFVAQWLRTIFDSDTL